LGQNRNSGLGGRSRVGRNSAEDQAILLLILALYSRATQLRLSNLDTSNIFILDISGTLGYFGDTILIFMLYPVGSLQFDQQPGLAGSGLSAG
jgi:hypothetical protein